MARAYGWNASALIKEEANYGELETDGYVKFPFSSFNLDSEQNLVTSNVIGMGRESSKPFQDVIEVSGDVNIPVDLNNIGLWLKALLGNPVTTENTGVFTHIYNSGKNQIPSYSIELGLPQIPDFSRYLGVKVNSMEFNFERSGEAGCKVSLLAQGEEKETTTIDNAPTEYDYVRVSQFQGYIKSNGTILANVTSASINYNNNLEKIETIRSDGKVEAIDIGMASLTGNISVRYADNILMNKAISGEAIDIELGYKIDDNHKLEIKCHEIYLPKPKRSISGPGGIDCSYDFQGAKNKDTGNMMTVNLVNEISGY